MTDKEEKLEILYHKLLLTIDELLENNDPLMIAGCMMSQSLSLYRTTLSEEDYNKILDGIIERRNQVKTFTGRKLH